jgi:hypothetical protein
MRQLANNSNPTIGLWYLRDRQRHGASQNCLAEIASIRRRRIT